MHILMFVDHVYEDLELWYPKLRLIEAGAGVTVAGPEMDTVYDGKNGYPCKSDAAIRDELTTLADHMQQLATRERGPDHGRMARHDRAMLHLIDDTDGAVKDHIETALDRLRAYRSTVEGV